MTGLDIDLSHHQGEIVVTNFKPRVVYVTDQPAKDVEFELNLGTNN